MWIVIVVVVWYAQGAFRSILDSSLYRVTWANFVEDPCWADASFLVETAGTISQTCVNITSAHNLFSQSSNNYRYYEAGKRATGVDPCPGNRTRGHMGTLINVSHGK